jgi:hypothetical protein
VINRNTAVPSMVTVFTICPFHGPISGRSRNVTLQVMRLW